MSEQSIRANTGHAHSPLITRLHFGRLLTFLLGASLSLAAAASPVVMDRIVAVVDEDVILQSEVEMRLNAVKTQTAASDQLPSDNELRQQIVERLVVENLQLQMADRVGVRISDEELNETLRTIAATNNMTLPEFLANLERDGVSYPAMREQVRRELKISRVQRGIMRNRIEISEQEIRNFLASEAGSVLTADEYRLAHILIPFPADPSDAEIQQVREQADNLKQRIDEGANFQQLAAAFSEGQNAAMGGDLGWRKIPQMPTLFADIVSDMNQGDVKGPIRSGSGFHLVTLLEKRGAKAEGLIPQKQVRHVLIQPSEIRSAPEARELAQSLRNEVAEGRSFDEVAKLFSDDPGSALSGGNLGWNRAGTFVPEFEKMIDNIALNELSPVFKSVHGYHFLEVTGERTEDFSERFMMGQAENYLRNQRFDEELANWIREIRGDAFVEIRI